ncbi:hypothetical protein RV11_GL003147 [Enterococcus phoeniculicola]|uniref:Response regulatory domain-containing protein n=1 Tax=Enterococcus phoeniculicola ATCC BAA-412 TaxID=1158610 RepID=R3WMH7_9ENTE|nr:LytTR family DNA-binding domain-containing protein [Enterococcus phoeniculicola]EOL43035.1 hypothetical protein UC3_02012 [Enterococcus phoeniculicola ATCC BAA-412]EOT76607.1 hypothetical protein I589_01564 [Enterococcus phoeniculicola ATCC BAA-412]OJG72176.1 hypothetical protein RV11_GL003147 [Enterococcus phoeniculicola]
MKIFICEDEPVILNLLSTSIFQYILFKDIDIKIGLATQSPEEIIETLQNEALGGDNLFFLDIDLKTEIDGITLATEIKKIDYNAKIVFITSHGELTSLVFKYQIEAMDYIIKSTPEIINERVRTCIDLAYKRFVYNKKSKEDNLLLKINGVFTKISLENVMFIESSKRAHKLVIHLVNSQVEFFGTIREIETMKKSLVRGHNSILVNINNIDRVDVPKRMLYFKNGEYCFASTRYMVGIKKILSIR